METTGVGISIVSKRMGLSGSVRVFPVEICLRPEIAQMSPASTVFISSRLFAWSLRILPILSLFPLVLLRTVSPCLSFPEYTLT